VITGWATQPHYLDHLAPVWRALGDDAGPIRVPRHLLAHGQRQGLPVASSVPQGGPTVVAGYRDLFAARRAGQRTPYVVMQHGAGQSYGWDQRSHANQSYPGGKDHDDVSLFIVPGPHAAARWRAAYPHARVVEVGQVKPLPREADLADPERQTVGLAFHWDCPLVPETRSAWHHFREALPRLDERWRVLGHGHPRWFGETLEPWYRANGIEPVASLDEMARRCDVLVADNTSALFEFAATGRPVVVLNAPWYRRNAQHGLRFWEAATVGINVDDPAGLNGAIRLALLDPKGLREERTRCVDMVYRGDGAAAAAEAIRAL